MQFPQKTVTNIFCPKMMFSLSKLTKIKGFLFTNFHKVGSGKKKKKKSVALLPRQNVWSCSLHGLFTKAIFYLYFWERLSPKIPYTYLLFLLNKHSSCKHNYSTEYICTYSLPAILRSNPSGINKTWSLTNRRFMNPIFMRHFPEFAQFRRHLKSLKTRTLQIKITVSNFTTS